MKSILNYINEALTPDDKTRRKELEKLLKNLDYEGYVEKLNEMLKDPRLAEIVKDTFGGPLATVNLKMSDMILSPGSLQPTQNEIDFTKSLSYGLSKDGADKIKNYFKNKVEIVMPIVTYNTSYIIDGHHRWSQVCCYNRDADLVCINFQGRLSAQEFLKTVQGSIAATLVSQGEDPAQLPVATVKPGMNILKMTDDALRKNIADEISDESVEELCKYVEDVVDKQTAIDYLTDNAIALRVNNPAISGASSRPYMPQTDKVEPRAKGELNPELKQRLQKTVKIK